MLDAKIEVRKLLSALTPALKLNDNCILRFNTDRFVLLASGAANVAYCESVLRPPAFNTYETSGVKFGIEAEKLKSR